MNNEPTASATLKINDKYKTPVQIGEHEIILDEPENNGGTDQGPTPFKSTLGSLASCTAMTIRMYFDHKGWKFKNLKVDVYYTEKREKQDESLSKEEEDFLRRGKVRKIHKIISVEGNLSEEQIKRMEKISQKCPVHQLLAGSCIIYDEIKKI